MLSEFEVKQISDWLSNTENIRSLSSEAQMKLAQANKEIQDAQFQLERAYQEVKNIVMNAMMGQQKTTFLFKL